MFGVVDVTNWAVELYEADGSDEKIWLIDPRSQRRALFKPNVRNDTPEQADHWPEKLASEIAGVLGIPAAPIDLAVRNGMRGCLSYDVRPANWELQPGFVLLGQHLGDHDPMDRKHVGHSLKNIGTVLRGYGSPPACSCPGGFDAFDVFVGYLVLDALIANRDRHPANWAVLLGPGPDDRSLCPSYDHATSLGFHLTDAIRARKLADGREWEAYLGRGTAHRFQDCARVSLVDLAKRGMDMVDADVRGYWIDQVRNCGKDRVEALAAVVPEMSPGARTFAVELVVANRRRLLDD
jgi:hypothetical protein